MRHGFYILSFLVIFTTQAFAGGWSSKCVRNYNSQARIAANPKLQMTCVNSVEELVDKAFTNGFYAHTKLALTAVKYLGIDPGLLDTDSKNKNQSIQFKYKGGSILDDCSMAFGRDIDPLVQSLFCSEKRGYRPYTPGKGEGFNQGFHKGRKTFVTSFRGVRAPVSLCIRQNEHKTSSGILPGWVVVAVFDLENFENAQYLGNCLEIVTGPVGAENRAGLPEGSIMQAGFFTQHPTHQLRRQEVIRLYPDVKPIKINK